MQITMVNMETYNRETGKCETPVKSGNFHGIFYVSLHEWPNLAKRRVDVQFVCSRATGEKHASFCMLARI